MPGEITSTTEPRIFPRLEKINILTNTLKKSEADRGARLEVIKVLTDRLNESEADRTARLEVISRLQAERDDAVRILEVPHLLLRAIVIAIVTRVKGLLRV